MFVVRFVAAVAALAVLSGSALAAEKPVTEHDRFDLWLNCRPVVLAARVFGTDARKIGLSSEAVAVLARRKLRAARLFDDNNGLVIHGGLAVAVSVVGAAFKVDLSLLHFVTRGKNHAADSKELSGLAVIWQRIAIGTHGRNVGYILETVSLYMDVFINEYLRVNNAACQRR